MEQLRKRHLVRTYGRGVLTLVERLKQESHPHKQQQMAYEIIKVMAQITGSRIEYPEVQYQLWQHLFELADYDLSIEAPVPILKKEEQRTPESLPYSNGKIEKRHYGALLSKLIAKFQQLPEEKRKAAAMPIAQIMKVLALRSSTMPPSDKTIWMELKELSRGTMSIEEEIEIPVPKAASSYKSYNHRNKRKDWTRNRWKK